MSREIKFRVWNEYLKEYRKLSFDGNDRGLGMHLECKDGTGGIIAYLTSSIGDSVEQFTGLKDKNGKDIYENDIIKVSDETGSSFVSVVKYFDYDDYPAFDLDPQYLPTDWYFEANILSTLKDDGTEIKVVGNIHENPDLLEVST